MTRLVVAVGLTTLAALATACGNDTPTPTSPSIPDSLVSGTSRLFTGTVGAQGSSFYSFTIPQDSGVFVTLASVTAENGRDALATPLQLGFGVPRGTGCAATTTVTVAAGLTPQLREYTTQGVHCVSVSDASTLTAPVRFAIRIGYFQ
ncbi:MAG: hypothetical protein R2745_15395 [Vicinamibacterales bacterium]